MKPFRYILSAILLLTLAMSLQAQTDAEHVRLTNLPHIYINTFTGRPVTSKTTTVLARMWYVDEQDNIAFYDSLEIRVRGNSTATLPKRPYRLKFQNKVKLLGKGFANAKKWTLLANHGDKTLLRNALTSQMGRFAGLPFNPAAKFVDLTLNNQYQGNYQLSDQVEVRPHRVDIAEQDYPLEDDSNITGAGPTGSSITGLPGHPVEDVWLSDITISQQGGQQQVAVPADEKEKDYPEATMWGVLPAKGFFVRHARHVHFRNIQITDIKPDKRPEYIKIDAE